MELDVITGIDYITYTEKEKMVCQAEILLSNGVNVFDKKKGISRYIDFFNAYDRYQNNKKRKDVDEPEGIIIPAPTFLKG